MPSTTLNINVLISKAWVTKYDQNVLDPIHIYKKYIYYINKKVQTPNQSIIQPFQRFLIERAVHQRFWLRKENAV